MLADELTRNSVVFVQGPYGVGKTAHSLAALEVLKQTHPHALFIGPNSGLGRPKFEASLEATNDLCLFGQACTNEPPRFGSPV